MKDYICVNIVLDLNVSIRGPRCVVSLRVAEQMSLRDDKTKHDSHLGCAQKRDRARAGGFGASLHLQVNPLSKQVDVKSLEQGQFKASYGFLSPTATVLSLH